MISLQCGITFCMNFTRSLNLRIALIHLVRSNLLSLANNNSILDFLDLSLHINEDNKICVDVYAKPTNSFTYVLPSTCYPKKSINKVPKGIALRLRRICDSDEKFDIRSSEYQNYLIAGDNNPTLVKKQLEIC